jgi:hypothetical protein
MSKLRISPDLALPIEAITQTIAILAMRGVGKTHTASVFAEELSAHDLPFVVLDPTGAWWGLRASADGKGDGYPVTILGGDHGDVPLEETAGKLIADLVAEKAPSLILDLSLLSKSAMRRFVADFAEELYRKNREPLHLIIDEADAFAPQKPRPDEMRMLGALDEIVRRGRIRGLGCTLVTQRSAVLNKDVLTQTEVLIVLRTAHPRDRAPVLEWMKVHASEMEVDEVAESLAKLPKGDAWIMSAGWLDIFQRVHIRERRTFNSSATPTPGQVRASPRRLAPVDLKLLQERMAGTIERAKANDPAALKRRVAELEGILAAALTRAERIDKKLERVVEKDDPKLGALVRQLRKAVNLAMKFIITINAEGFLKAGGGTIEPAELDKAIRAAVASVSKNIEAKFDARNREIERLKREASHVLASLKALADADVPVEITVAHREPFAVSAVTHSRSSYQPVDGERGPLKPAIRRVLEAAARLHPAPVSKRQLATLAIYKPKGGGFANIIGELRGRGLFSGPNSAISVTEAGLAQVDPEVLRPRSPEELREMWQMRLKPSEWRVLKAALDVYPQTLSKAELAARCDPPYDPAGGGFSNLVGSLRAAVLLEGRNDAIRANPNLMEAV